MASPWNVYYQPKLELVNLNENEVPYVIEMFGELYFAENHPRPLTMSELLGDWPKPVPLPPKNENFPSYNQDEKGTGEEKMVTKDDEQQMRPCKPRRRLMTRASLYNYVPTENKEKKVYPRVIHSLRPFNKRNPMFTPVCDLCDRTVCMCDVPQEKNEYIPR